MSCKLNQFCPKQNMDVVRSFIQTLESLLVKILGLIPPFKSRFSCRFGCTVLCSKSLAVSGGMYYYDSFHL